MPVAEHAAPSISPPVRKPVGTNADTQALISRVGWQPYIDRMLSWLSNPDQIEDENIEAPSHTIIRLALDIAESLRDQSWVPPDSIVPDPNGGIVFERRQGDSSEVIHLWSEGDVEYMNFVGTSLVCRRPFFE
jgi:hypothetical protein